MDDVEEEIRAGGLYNEMWQVFANIPNVFLGLVAALFAALGTMFLTARLPLGRESECDPLAKKGWFPETTDAPPLSDQPFEPLSSPPFGAR